MGYLAVSKLHYNSNWIIAPICAYSNTMGFNIKIVPYFAVIKTFTFMLFPRFCNMSVGIWSFSYTSIGEVRNWCRVRMSRAPLDPRMHCYSLSYMCLKSGLWAGHLSSSTPDHVFMELTLCKRTFAGTCFSSKGKSSCCSLPKHYGELLILWTQFGKAIV